MSITWGEEVEERERGEGGEGEGRSDRWRKGETEMATEQEERGEKQVLWSMKGKMQNPIITGKVWMMKRQWNSLINNRAQEQLSPADNDYQIKIPTRG